MSRTISTTGDPPDIDGNIATDIESLRQRIRSAIRFRLHEWFYAPNEGVDYDLLLGHTTSTGQAAQLIVSTIRTEGRHEITGVRDVNYDIDRTTRRFQFKCTADTIYGTMDITETIPGG